jgi:hypothetical protein
VTTGSDIERRLSEFLSNPELDRGLKKLRAILPAGAAMYLVGGAIRNLAIEAIHGYRPKIRDLDIFVNRVPVDIVLFDLFPGGRAEKTDLGGIRWRPQGCSCDFDLWLMKDFVVLEKLNLPPTLENLLSTIDFTMNTLVFDLKQRRLHQRSALFDIRNRLLEFNTRVFYTRLAIFYRCLLLRRKIGFVFSEAVYHFLRGEVVLDTVEAARQLLRARHGKATAHRVLKDYDRVCTSSSYEDYIAVKDEEDRRKDE